MRDLHGVTTLTFDVVGTVIDFETGILDWWRPYLQEQGVEVDDEAILAAVAEAEDRLQVSHPHLPYNEMLPTVHRDIARAWELRGGEAAGRSFQASIVSWPAFEDAEAALGELGRRYQLVAASNTDRWTAEAMNRRVGSPFQHLVTTDEVGVNKPDPRFFLHVLEVSGVEASDVLHVAQSQYHDLASAKACGLATAWVERRHGREGTGATPPTEATVEPDLHVVSLAELVERLGVETPS